MRIRLLALLLLVLPLAACGQVPPDDPAAVGDLEAEPSPSGQETALPGAEPSETSSEATSAPLAGAQRCTDDVVGYEIAYPAGWVTNEDDVLPTCRLFDPDSIEVEADTEIPLDIAVSLRTTDHALADIAEDDDGATVLASSRTRVDGHEVAVVHKRGNGEALVPEDVRFTQHVIDLGQQRLVASTFDVGTSYDANREVLATMVESLEVFVDAGAVDQEEQAAQEVTLPSSRQVCTRDLSGGEQIEFAYPEGWQVEDGDCQFFDPRRDSLASDTEPDVAMSVRVSDVAFSDAIAADPATRDEITYVSATAGRATVRVRATATGQAQRPEGAPSLVYLVDLGDEGGEGDGGGRTLIATASASRSASFDLAAHALDSTMRTLSIAPPIPAAETAAVTHRATGPTPYAVTFDHECFRLHRPGPTDAPVDEACGVSLDDEAMAATLLEDGDLQVAAGLGPPRAGFVVSDAASAPYGALTMGLEGATAFAYEVVGLPVEVRALDRHQEPLATTTLN